MTAQACRRCGCTETNACVVLDQDGSFRGCSWDPTAPGPGVTCSACTGQERRVRGARR